MANFPRETRRRPSICSNCNSKSYCANAAPGVTDCENFNKFPKPMHDEPKPAHRN